MTHWRQTHSVTGHSPPDRFNSLDLGRGPFLQAVLDTINVVFGLLFISALAASLPLAVVLMFFASF
jgi:hypothetical protein